MKNEIQPVMINSSGMNKDVPLVDVIIEIPRGSFLKRGSNGKLDFVSPLPCPFNYGSVPAFIGLDGDLLDAVVLGPRLPAGTTLSVYAWGAIGMIDRGIYEDKLICALMPIPLWKQRLVFLFFMIYAKAKYLINLTRGRVGHNRCVGWHDAASALARARPCVHAD